jgi:four helix bundle protein
MAYRRFEDLPVWNDAIDLAIRTFAFTSTGCLKGFAGLRDQLERAVVSISNNIAEGFERGTNEELLTFLYIARGSAGEVRSMLCLIGRLTESESPEAIRQLGTRTESVSRQLGGWIESIKNSGFKGTRYQSETTRKADHDMHRREAFLRELQRVQDEAKRDPGISGKGKPHDGSTH